MLNRVKHMGLIVVASCLQVACGGNGSAVIAEPDALGALPDGNVIVFGEATTIVFEDQRAIRLPVIRSGDAKGTASVDYISSDVTAEEGEDYRAVNGTLTWADGETGSQDIVLIIESDLFDEPEETMTVSLVNGQGSDDISARPSVDVTIMNSTCAPILDASVSDSITLTEPCYQLSQSLSVYDGGVLSLDSGTTIIAHAGTAIDVLEGGVISSSGTAVRPVSIRGSESNPGHWLGLNLIDSDSSQNELTYTTIRDAEIGLAANRYSRIGNFSNNTLTKNSVSAAEVSAAIASMFDSESSYKGNTEDYVTITGDTIDDSVRWSALDVPYLSRGTLVINGRLELEAGTSIHFGDGDLVFVSDFGVLQTLGTAAQPILLTGKNQTPGFWKGLHFASSQNNDNSLDHTEVSYGGGDPTYPANVAIYGVQPSVSIKNSHIAHSSGFGIWVLSNEFSVNVTDTTYAENAAEDYSEQ